MGFRLTNEGKIIPNKFVTSNRFILHEDIYDDVSDYCDSILDFLEKRINEAENQGADNNQNKTVLSDLLSKINELRVRMEKQTAIIKKSADPAKVKAAVTEFVNDADAMLKNLDTASLPTEYSQVDKYFNEIKKVAANSSFTKETVATLKDNVTKITEAINVVLNKVSKMTSDNKVVGTKTVSTGEYIGILQRTYKDIAIAQALAKSKNSKLTDSMISDIKNLYNKASMDKLVDFMELCEKTHAGNFGTNLAKAGVEPTQTLDNKDKIDWAGKYESMTNKKVFWEEYYAAYWGKDASRVAKLGKAYQQECLVFGFKEDTNPFIKYLRAYLPKVDIKPEIYFAIHDEVANHGMAITKKDLETGGRNECILKNKAFYTQSGDNARSYLSYIDSIYRLNLDSVEAKRDNIKAKGAGAETEEKMFVNLTTYINSAGTSTYHFDNSKAEDKSYCVWAIAYNKTATSTMTNTPNSGAIAQEDASASTLRPLADIKSLTSVLGIEVSTRRNWTPTSGTDLVKALKNDATITNKTQFARTIVYIACLAFLTGTDIVNTLKKPATPLDTFTPASASDVVDAKTFLLKFGTNLTRKNIEDLIAALEAEGLL